MKKFFLASTALIVLCLIMSCGKSRKIEWISYFDDDNTKALREVVQIHSNDCEIEKGENGYKTTLVLESQYSSSTEGEWKELVSAVTNGTIVLVLLDDNNVEVGEMELENPKEMFDWLKGSLDSYAKKPFTFTGNLSDDACSKAHRIQYKFKGNTSSSASIDVSGIQSSDSEDTSDVNLDTDDSDGEAEDVAEVQEEVSSNNSEDWDALLDSYERYTDKLIALSKKTKNGDMDAFSEYNSAMAEAQELGEKMQKAQGSMSASQWARYNKILQKLMKAAQNQ